MKRASSCFLKKQNWNQKRDSVFVDAAFFIVYFPKDLLSTYYVSFTQLDSQNTQTNRIRLQSLMENLTKESKQEKNCMIALF